MYVVANCMFNSAPYLGRVELADSMEDAVNIAVKMVMEQLGQPGDDDEAAVKAELEADASYYDPNGDWSVCIGQPG